jgi:zinc/manganese transport system substrate-binding protein
MNWLKTTLAAAALAAATPSTAALNIFACEPEWGALAKELAGEKASIYVATTALQDPHHIEARPSLIARARTADLVVCTGADLEVGWMPLVQTQSGNPRIQLGRPGYFEAAEFVTKLEVPQVLDRSLGDVHPAGNPHIHLDPYNIARIAEALGGRLAALDSANGDYYRAQSKQFLSRWREAIARWEKQGAVLSGLPIVVYHKNLSYFVSWLKLREAGTLEPKPGIPPSAGHLAELLSQLQRQPVKAVVRAAYNEPRAADWLAERAGIPSVVVPFTVGGTDKAKDLFSLFDDTLARLLLVAK